MIIGNIDSFAIESAITTSYPSLSTRALGFFVIYINGHRYGVRSPDATLLACSYDAIRSRIDHRGSHVADFGSEPSAAKIADAVRAASYDLKRREETFFDMPCEDFLKLLNSSNLLWAPDGDAAFDDGGHVIQLDQDSQVRIIAFKNDVSEAIEVNEIFIDSGEFYGLLQKWLDGFESEWKVALTGG